MPHRLRRISTLSLALGAGLVLTPPASAYVYWGSDMQGGVGRAALDGTGATPAFIPPAGPNNGFTSGVASDGTFVYFGDHFSSGGPVNVIGRAKLDGSEIVRSFSQSTGQWITGLAATPSFLFWSAASQDKSSIGRTPVIGGQQFSAIDSVYGQPNPRSCGVAADATHVYFANPQTYSIGRAEIANMGTPSQVVDGEWIRLPVGVKPCGVAVDDASIYYGILDAAPTSPSATVAPPGTTVYRASKATGTGATVISGDGNEVTGVAVAGDYVYFSNHGRYAPGAGSIKRVAKDGRGGTLTLVSGLTATWSVAADLAGVPAAPDTPVPPPAQYIPPLNVGCGNCGGSAPPGPPAVRPDFSRVWVTKSTFQPANWNTPLSVSVSTKASAAHTRASRPVTATTAVGASAQKAPLPTSGPGGTALNFILAQDATVKLAINRVSSGRLKGKSCKKPPAKTGKKKKCDLLKLVATLTRTSQAGTNTVPFSGRINDKALAPGTYRVIFTASAGTLAADAKSVDLTIKPGS